MCYIEVNFPLNRKTLSGFQLSVFLPFGLVWCCIYSFSNTLTLSTGFFLNIFLEFRKFQPRYSYKIYSWNDDVNCENTNLRDI